jgi:hypothetical protein
VKIVRISALLLTVVAISACSHPMIIKPEMEALTAIPQAERIQKKVGLYIPAANRQKQVTTPGGGGDKVTYAPYADLEAGLYKVLSDVFLDVAVLQTADAASFAQHSLSYVFEPDISTMSSSSGVFTWMATDFTVQLQCKVTDVAGQIIASVLAEGTGQADSKEVLRNFSIAGQRASQDALLKLRAVLLQSSELRK